MKSKLMRTMMMAATVVMAWFMNSQVAYAEVPAYDFIEGGPSSSATQGVSFDYGMQIKPVEIAPDEDPPSFSGLRWFDDDGSIQADEIRAKWGLDVSYSLYAAGNYFYGISGTPTKTGHIYLKWRESDDIIFTLTIKAAGGDVNHGTGAGRTGGKDSSSVGTSATIALPETDPSGRPNYGADGHIHNWGPNEKVGNVSYCTCSICNLKWSYGHNHAYEWVETKQATEDDNGECEYRCRICGEVLYRVPTNAMGVFAQNTINKIVKAHQGETVVITTSRWYSFPKSVFDALAARPDLTLTVNYLSEGYKGDPMSFTIPAGTDVSTLPDANGYAGFTYLGGLFEATSR